MPAAWIGRDTQYAPGLIRAFFHPLLQFHCRRRRLLMKDFVQNTRHAVGPVGAGFDRIRDWISKRLRNLRQIIHAGPISDAAEENMFAGQFGSPAWLLPQQADERALPLASLAPPLLAP